MALQEVTVQAGPAEGRGWSVRRLQTRLRFLPGDRIGLNLEAAGVRLPGPLASIRGFRADCGDASLNAAGFRCRGGVIEVTQAPGLPRLEPASFEFEYQRDRFRLKIDGLKTGDSALRVEASGTGAQWSLEAEGSQLPLAAITALAGDRVPDSLLKISSGTVSGSVHWEAGAGGGSLAAVLRVQDLAFSDAAGLNVGEKVAIDVDVRARRAGGPWQYSVGAKLSGGQVYFHPVFLDADAHAVGFDADGEFDAPAGEIRVRHFHGRHNDVAEVEGSAFLKTGDDGVQPLEFETGIRVIDMQVFHAVFLQPWLVGSALAGAELDGTLRASLSWASGGPSHAILELDDLSIDDAQARYGVLGLNGELRWTDDRLEEPSRLGWRGAHFYRVDIGGGELLGRFAGRRFRLQEPVLFPLLGGVVAVESLEAANLGTGGATWRFSGRLTPVSLAELSNRLAWPPFSGTVSGVIPSVRYADGDITVDGTLSMEAFDGTILISNLKLSQPFGVVPRATADVSLSNLSLDALTRTFSFGSIEGRLDGRVDNLVLENWKPAEFNAEFATPEGDTSRHRISQRAVENLASLGGAGRVLSSTLLRFLETFSYDRLGISCRLRNGVCEMGGIESAERGYYIVKGGGVPPRINVLGFNDRVDWNKLVQRLKAARLDRAVVQ